MAALEDLSSADSVDTHEDTEAQNTKAELEKIEMEIQELKCNLGMVDIGATSSTGPAQEV